jgi:hypothetical protein
MNAADDSAQESTDYKCFNQHIVFHASPVISAHRLLRRHVPGSEICISISARFRWLHYRLLQCMSRRCPRPPLACHPSQCRQSWCCVGNARGQDISWQGRTRRRDLENPARRWAAHKTDQRQRRHGVVLGFITTYPVNWLLVKLGVKSSIGAR